MIKQGESDRLEFNKSTKHLREAIETITAFANSDGGILIFGIDDKGTPTGQEITDETLKNVSNSIRLNTDPKLFPKVEIQNIDSVKCLVVTVDESPLRPHLAYGRPFLRVGSTTQKMDRENYELQMQSRLNGYGFDHQINVNATMDDIDSDAVYEFLERANSIRNLNENLLLPIDVVLEKLDLAKNGKLTNASLLLFSKKPEKFYLGQFETKCGHFQDDFGYTEIWNDKEFKANLLDNYRSIFAFVMDGLQLKSQKTPGAREETIEFPVSVIREAIVNQLVHRDYRIGIKNTLEIRPSHILFSNPGTLFQPTITVERLKIHHPSRPGNKLIAKIFYLAGIFENWGSGTLQIINDSIQSGKKEPNFYYENQIFRLKLYR